MNRFVAAVVAAVLASAPMAASAENYNRYSDAAAQSELSRIAEVEMAVMVPMRDGVGLATNIYRPKGAKGALPTVFIKTPYNELAYNARSTRTALTWVSRGYALVMQNERGRYFSQGEYEILGYPQTDGYDALTWIAAHPWSNGKVGTLGC